MRAIRALVFEVVKERYDVRSAWMSLRRGQRGIWVLLGRFYGWSGRGDQPLQKLDFVERSLGVPWSGLYDFKSNMTVGPDWLCE